MQRFGIWEGIEGNTARLAAGLSAAAEETGVSIVTQCVGTVFTLFFADQPVINWATAKMADTKMFGAFVWEMLESGVYLLPSQFEAGFMSTRHSEHELQFTVQAAERAFRRILER